MVLTREHIAELVQNIGHEMVADLANSPNRQIVCMWLRGTQTPTSEQAKRVAFALKWFNEMKHPPLARLWMQCENVTLASRPNKPITPWEAIRIGDFDAVEKSAKRVIQHIWEP